MNKFIVLFFLFALITTKSLYSQKRDLVQFAGIVVTADSLKPIPFANIYIKNAHKGTISNFYGFFSFVARTNDTIVFSCMGYKKKYYIVPDTLKNIYYNMFQVMNPDTIYLSETIIYPWPIPSQFKQAFINLRVPDDDYDRARKNIAMMASKDYFIKTPMDGSMNYKHFIQDKIQNYYTMGQLPVNNLINPFAWAQFFKAWQSGKFKRSDINYSNYYPAD